MLSHCLLFSLSYKRNDQKSHIYTQFSLLLSFALICVKFASGYVFCSVMMKMYVILK